MAILHNPYYRFQHTAARRRLEQKFWVLVILPKFQHTAARRRLEILDGELFRLFQFQHTAARRRLGGDWPRCGCQWAVSTHSRPKAAGIRLWLSSASVIVSTHSRPKAAGQPRRSQTQAGLFQHTAARRRLVGRYITNSKTSPFQHTAARRRLDGCSQKYCY